MTSKYRKLRVPENCGKSECGSEACGECFECLYAQARHALDSERARAHEATKCAVAAERERCARLADKGVRSCPGYLTRKPCNHQSATACVAAAIRAGEKDSP